MFPPITFTEHALVLRRNKIREVARKNSKVLAFYYLLSDCLQKFHDSLEEVGKKLKLKKLNDPL